MLTYHKDLVAGKWFTLSLAEQLGNVGSEISRAINWHKKDQKTSEHAIDRALELLDLTIQDARWRKRLKELVRTREVLCDALLEGKEYGSALEDLNQYFFYFAVAARSRA